MAKDNGECWMGVELQMVSFNTGASWSISSRCQGTSSMCTSLVSKKVSLRVFGIVVSSEQSLVVISAV